jgi:HEAT repeat protein
MYSRKRILMTVTAAVLLAWTVVPLVAEGPASSQGEAQKLMGVLKSDAPIFDKAKACQRLAVIGTKEAVPVLAGLLADEQLAHYARFGLEPIPDPSVDDALRDAMGKLKGKLLVGVINSIGVRRDAKALEGLTKLLGDPDSQAASAAAAALGKIGTTDAAKVLKGALSGAAEILRPTIAEAMLPCAERLLAQEKRDEAVALYDAVRQAAVPQHIVLAATRGAIVERREAGIPLLAEKLQGSDPASFALALGVCREMRGSGVTRALVSQLGKLEPQKRALLIAALGDRGDSAALPAVIDAAKGGPPETRFAAMRALARLGDASAVPVLIDAAQGEGDVAQAAQDALASLEGNEIDAAIVGMLEQGDSKLRPVLIELVGRRRITSAVSALRKAADEPDEAVRTAAIQALGKTVSLEGLPVLMERLVHPKSPQDKARVQEALKSACVRMPDRDACAAKLVESLAQAPAEAKGSILDLFSAVGGTKALQAVSASAGDADEAIQDAAVRVLGEWRSEDAASALLGLAKGSEKEKDRARALRGFSHLVRRLGFPKEQKLALCKQALEIARSDEEKKIGLEALTGVPAPETLELLSPYLAAPALKEDACSAMATIAERIIRLKADAARDAMKKVLENTKDEQLAQRARKLLKEGGQEK